MGGVLVNQNNEPQAFGGDIHAEVGIADDADDEADEDDYIEEYDPEMSPEPADPRTMHLDERRLPIVTEEDEWRALVSAITPGVSALADTIRSSKPVALSHPPISCRDNTRREQHQPRQKRCIDHLPQIWKPNGSTEKKHSGSVMRWARMRVKRSSAISTTCSMIFKYHRRTTGAIDIDPGSPDSSTEFIPDSSGANTTKRITSESSF